MALNIVCQAYINGLRRKAVCPITSMSYTNAQPHILGDVDLKLVRLAIVAERERRGLNQRQLAAKAGVDQGHMSKIENVDGEEMRDLAARIVFQLIERGLDMPVSQFFAQVEGLSVPVPRVDDQALPPDKASPVDETVPTFTAQDRVFYKIGKAIATIVDQQRSESERRANRRSTADPSDRPTRDGLRARSAGQGPGQSRKRGLTDPRKR
jgi:transcriptional regulator with XRE-family HTH domain